MNLIELSATTSDRLSLLARAWALSEAETVGRLLDEFARPPQPDGDEPEIGIHAVYKGARCDGIYDPRTGSLYFDAGPLAGLNFDSPSPAAAALVREVAPGVSPNRNGWGFWTVTRTGKPLQSVR